MQTRQSLFAGCISALMLLCSSPAHTTTGLPDNWELMFVPACQKHIKSFAAKWEAPYKKWRERNPESALAYERNIQTLPDAPIDNMQELHTECERLLNRFVEEARPPENRFAKPEGTWRTFLTALRSGDKTTLADCFNVDEREQYQEIFADMTSAEMNDFAKSFAEFHLSAAASSDTQEAVVTRLDGTAGIVLFVKTARGWQLAQL